jgi:hypothetical protein
MELKSALKEINAIAFPTQNFITILWSPESSFHCICLFVRDIACHLYWMLMDCVLEDYNGESMWELPPPQHQHLGTIPFLNKSGGSDVKEGLYLLLFMSEVEKHRMNFRWHEFGEIRSLVSDESDCFLTGGPFALTMKKWKVHLVNSSLFII